MAKSNLGIRLTTAGVVAPLLLLTMFYAPVWAWYLVVFVATLLASDELFRMTHPADPVARGIGIASSGVVSVVLYRYGHDPRALVSILFGVPIVGVLVPLWRLGQMETAALRVMAGVAGPLYIGGLLSTVALIRRDQGEAGPEYVVMTLMFAWLADTGGYFFGRFFGRKKLYEAISPKKTREGFLGALVGAVAGGLLAHYWFLPSIPLGHVLPLSILCGGLGQLGDLVESLLKRSTDIKDSGWLVPGHGGILDRIDALLIVSPLVYLYALWLDS